MHKANTIFTCVALIGGLLLPQMVRADEPNVAELVDHIDKLYRSKSSQVKVEMQINTPHWERTLAMHMWSEGMKKTFITITSPAKERGVSTLRVDNEMWNYFPRIDKVMKVPPSMMMGSWMGSDFTNDDLVKESTMRDDYDHELIKPDDANPDYYYIKLTPKQQTVSVWGKIIAVLQKSDYIPVRQEYYDEKGKKMRVMEFTDVKEIGGRRLPCTLVMTPLNKENHRTMVRYLAAQFDMPLDQDLFSLRNLKKRR